MLQAPVSDEEIVEKLKESSDYQENEITSEYRTYFKMIVERYYKHAFNLCRYYGVQANDADDIVQESLIKLHKWIKSFKTGMKFKPWFFKIVINKLRDKCNENSRHPFEDLQDFREDLVSEEENISDKFQNRDFITGIINRIPEKLRRIMILKIYNDLDYEEISRIEKISSRQVRNRMEKACELVRVYLEKENYPGGGK